MNSSAISRFPTARVESVSKTIGGITFEDPYAWLQDDSPEALEYQWAQDAAAQQYLDGLPQAPALREAMRALYSDPLRVYMGGQYRRLGSHWFTIGPTPEGNVAIWVIDSLDGEKHILVDTAQLARELGTDLAVTITWWQPSPDGRHVAFSVATGGEMVGSWRVVEVDSGQLLPLVIPAALFTGAMPGWLPDGSGFFFFDRAEDNRHRVRRFDLQSGEQSGSQRVFDSSWISDVTPGVLPQVSPRGRWVAGMSMPHEHVTYVLGDLKTGEWRQFLPEGFEGECHGCWLDDDTYLAIVTDETPRGRVAAIPAATSQDLSTWRTLVPESEAVPRAVTIVGDRIVLCETVDASVRFRLFQLDGTPDGEVPLEPHGSSSTAQLMRRFEDSEELAFFHNTFTRAGTDYHFDVATRELTVIGEPGERVEGLSVSQRFATSKDGTRVPYFIVHHADLDRSEPQPTLINGYGGFNIAWLPTYLGPLAPFLDAGGVYVHSNLRGGAEYGREWYNAGRLHNKGNTFDDLFAVAEDAIAAGITTQERLAFKGDSNGGMLAGVAIVRRPDLWRVVVAGVPVFDMMEPLPGDDPTTAAIRAIFEEDWGNPSNPADAPISYAYSPYHNIREDVAYPAVLQVFGDKDIGSKPFHGRKFTARLQAASTSDRPVLMRVWKDTGHGAFDPEVAAAQQAEWLGFVMHQLMNPLLDPISRVPTVARMSLHYSAVLFDMDGVVVDTERSITAFWQRMADRFGVTLSQNDLERHVYGRPAERTLDVLFPRASVDERQSVHVAMRQHETGDRYYPLPGIVSLLQTLQRHAIRAALVTSGGPWKVDAVLDQLGIVDLFVARVTAADVSLGKPDPQCYLLGARMVGIQPQHCLVFEDAVSGVEAAVAAGATCIGIAPPERGHALIAAGAAHTIPDFSSVIYRDGALDLLDGMTLPLGARQPGPARGHLP